MQSLLFKIIAEAPVAQHFEHSMVIGINTHFFEIVMFSAYAKAFLGIGNTGGFKAFFITEKNNL